MKNLDLTSLLNQVHQLDRELVKQKEQIFCIVFIKLWGWNTSDFIPVLFLSRENIHLLIKDNFTSIPLNRIKNLGLKYAENKDNYLKLCLEIEKDDDIELSLVYIDDSFDNPNDVYTENLFHLLKLLKAKNDIPSKLLESLPNQKDLGMKTSRVLPLVITGILMITFGILVQGINLLLGWALLFSGLLMILIGVSLAAFKDFVKSKKTL